VPFDLVARSADRRSITRWRPLSRTTGFPMVPAKSPKGELFLRRGTMEIPTATGFVDLKARALILEPQHPFI
jgi:hypothetical protein